MPPYCICFLRLIAEITVYFQTAPDVVSWPWIVGTPTQNTQRLEVNTGRRESDCSAVCDEILSNEWIRL